MTDKPGWNTKEVLKANLVTLHVEETDAANAVDAAEQALIDAKEHQHQIVLEIGRVQAALDAYLFEPTQSEPEQPVDYYGQIWGLFAGSPSGEALTTKQIRSALNIKISGSELDKVLSRLQREKLICNVRRATWTREEVT